VEQDQTRQTNKPKGKAGQSGLFCRLEKSQGITPGNIEMRLQINTSH